MGQPKRRKAKTRTKPSQGTGQITTTLRLPSGVLGHIDYAAEETGIPRASLLRMALIDGLNAFCDRYGLERTPFRKMREVVKKKEG